MSQTIVQVFLHFSLVVFCLLPSPLLGAQQAGGVAAAGPQVHVVRSLVGAKGEQRNGSFIMTEPRSIAPRSDISSPTRPGKPRSARCRLFA